jgi:hypothetical protein
MNDYVYKYEHTNGQIITKPRVVVETNMTPEEYFNSSFVKRWWKEELKPQRYCLNAGAKVPECKNGGGHDYEQLQSPPGHRSGWHVDRCKVCGIIVEYDTSD